MAKLVVGDWDTTAAGNTDVGSINIGEGWAAASMNNAIREMMAQIAVWRDAFSLTTASFTNLTANTATVAGNLTAQRAAITNAVVTNMTVSATGNFRTLRTYRNDGPNQTVLVGTDHTNSIAGEVAFFGRDLAGNETNYVKIRANIIDATEGSEDGELAFLGQIGGAEGTLFSVVGNAVSINTGSLTGNDGKISAARFSRFTSSGQTIAAGTTLTLAHSLGAAPFMVQLAIKMGASTELGYAANDEVVVNFNDNGSSGSNSGFAVVMDATNVNVYISSDAPFQIVVPNKGGTYTLAAIDPTKWTLIVRAML